MTENIDEIKNILLKWKGSRSKLILYHVTFNILEIRLERETKMGNIHLICSPCEYMRMPVLWKVGTVDIETIKEWKPLGNTYKISDEFNSFEIVCNGVTLAENVHPVFHF